MSKLPTYDDACEQLGGRPWLDEPEATDRWFLTDPKMLLTPAEGIAAMSEITAGIDLRKSMSLSTKLAILVIVVFGAIAAAAINLLPATR
jgi:hypothetical protein